MKDVSRMLTSFCQRSAGLQHEQEIEAMGQPLF